MPVVLVEPVHHRQCMRDRRRRIPSRQRRLSSAGIHHASTVTLPLRIRCRPQPTRLRGRLSLRRLLPADVDQPQQPKPARAGRAHSFAPSTGSHRPARDPAGTGSPDQPHGPPRQPRATATTAAHRRPQHRHEAELHAPPATHRTNEAPQQSRCRSSRTHTRPTNLTRSLVQLTDHHSHGNASRSRASPPSLVASPACPAVIGAETGGRTGGTIEAGRGGKGTGGGGDCSGRRGRPGIQHRRRCSRGRRSLRPSPAAEQVRADGSAQVDRKSVPPLSGGEDRCCEPHSSPGA